MIEWVILSCFNCDPKEQRANGWSYEVVASQRQGFMSDWDSDLSDRRVEQLGNKTFKSQRACLQALYKSMPAYKLRREKLRGDWFETSHAVTHYRDYVEAFAFTNFTQTFEFACFHKTGPLS